ncbi:MAG: 30S ribosomal protein S4 [Clostridia bacterium]
MARYNEAVCRLCRREGAKMFLKGDRCYSVKCAMEKRAFAPGQHGQSRKKSSEYGIQMRMKQRTRRTYGVLEKQFRNYFDKAERIKGLAGENLLVLLEKRLDNIVYRLGFSNSRAEARQLVRHGHFTLNGHKVNIPSIQLAVGDEISLREKSRTSAKFKDLADLAASKSVPTWLASNAADFSAKVVALPTREDADSSINERLIVELYSR